MGTNNHLLLHLVVGTLISSALICLVSAQYDLADQPFVLDNGLVYRDLFTIESSKAVGDFARAYDVQEKVEVNITQVSFLKEIFQFLPQKCSKSCQDDKSLY